jgi:phosphoribosylanthranilate isomerase
MRTKICGIRNHEDALTAIRAGANAVGFLVGITHLAEDKIDKETAKEIIGKLPPFVSRVLVTHFTNENAIVDLAEYLGVDTIQIHDYIPPKAVLHVKETLPYCKIIKAVHIINESEAVELMHDFETVSDALLLDSRTADRLGGTGMVHDWNISKKIVSLSQVPVILAGGLTNTNVFDAVVKTRPFGVDVNSGVEVTGWKNYEKIKQFITEACRAEITD